MTARQDLVVIGAGPNGLTTATLLARAGRDVTVLERRDVVGGMASIEEFHPGYRAPGPLQDAAIVRPAAVDGLQLEKHGLEMRRRPATLLALEPDGDGLRLDGDPARAAEQIGKRSSSDASRYLDYRKQIEQVRPVLAGFFDAPPLDLVRFESNRTADLLKRGLDLRRLGKRRMMDLLRLPAMPVADWLDEWFETDLLKGLLALPAVSGTFSGPRSPGSNMNLLRAETLGSAGPRGDAPALMKALEAAARASGVRIRTSAAVSRLLLDGERIVGVGLEGGDEIRCRNIAASCDPRRLFLDLMPRGSISSRLEHRMRSYRVRGTTAQVLLALDRPAELVHAGEEPIAHARLAGSLDVLERAFDAVKYRRVSERPALDVYLPTVAHPDFAPPGHGVVSVLLHFVPYDLEGGWDGFREALADRVVALLADHIPGLPGAVVGRAVRVPPDLEQIYASTGGHLHHGEHALDQLLVRPAPECIGYRTPFEGLFLCGSGSHPGGGLTCGPGTLAAGAIRTASA